MNQKSIFLAFIRSAPDRGYITLISVLVIGALGTAIATSLILLGIGSSRTSFVVEQSAQAVTLADSCAEEALEQIRELSSYVGSDTLAFTNGTCEYEVIDGGGENRSIQTVGVVGTVVRRVSVEISAIEPDIVVTSWKEVVE